MTKARPNDKDARNKYTECNKIVKRLAFEKAIAVEETEKKSIADSINLESMCKLVILEFFTRDYFSNYMYSFNCESGMATDF